MQYSVWPKLKCRTPIPRLPLRPPDDYLRNAMVATLAKEDVEFDIRLQMQTDPHLMPLENNAVLWPEKLSPRDFGGHTATAAAEIQLSCADGFRQTAFLQSVALHCRASSAGQSEPRPTAHV